MKKIATIALALALALTAMAAPAFAAQNLDTEAGVNFIKGSGPEIVDPGEDPMDGIDTMSIHFGTRARYKVQKVFDSMDGSNLGDGESLAGTDKQRIGLTVRNDDANAYWKVTCASGPFMSGSKHTLKDYELRLIENGGIKQELAAGETTYGPAPTAMTETEAKTTFMKANGTGFGAPIKLFTTGKDAENEYSIGRWGTNYKGQLTAPGNSMMNAGNDDVTATLKWVLEKTP